MQVAENNGNQNERHHIGRHNTQRSYQTKLHQQGTAREIKDKKANAGGDVGKERSFRPLSRWQSSGLPLWLRFAVQFFVVPIEQENNVGHPNNNDQGWNKARQQGDVIAQQNNIACSPNYRQRLPRQGPIRTTGERPEKVEQNQGRYQKSQPQKQKHFLTDFGRKLGSDVGHPRHVYRATREGEATELVQVCAVGQMNRLRLRPAERAQSGFWY